MPYIVLVFGVLWIVIALKEYKTGFGSGYNNVVVAIAVGLCGAVFALFVLTFAALFVAATIQVATGLL